MTAHHKINYIEIPVKDVASSKAFFSNVFGWEYIDYGPDYVAITNAGIDAGMFLSDTTISTATGSVLVVFYSDDLDQTQQTIERYDGKVIKPIFAFPGGRRFHFADLNGNEYAVWSDK